MGGDGAFHKHGSRVVVMHLNAAGEPAPVLGVVTGIAEDETRGGELCAFVRQYRTHPTKMDELVFDWTSSGQVQVLVSGPMLRADMPFSVVSRAEYQQVAKPGHMVYVCDYALTDDKTVPGGTHIIPLDDAPKCWADKFCVDLSSLDEVLDLRPDLRVCRLFLTNFNDDFGFYSKVYHKTKGRYIMISLGNLPYTHQVLLKNIVALTMSPPGTDPAVAVEPFNAGCKWLQQGHVMDLGPELGSVFAIGGMGVGTTDCPQGNDDAGCKRQNARKGCRICTAPSESTGDCDTEFPRRLKKNMDDVRSAVSSAATQKERDAILSEFGLREDVSIYNTLAVDTHTHTHTHTYTHTQTHTHTHTHTHTRTHSLLVLGHAKGCYVGFDCAHAFG
jgi:hypothetical protein